ncbi:hypothetical protein AAG906_039581 [Vitis piasezkii]
MTLKVYADYLRDIDFEESTSTAFKDARYNPNDCLAFIASVEFVHDNDYDSDRDDEFTDEQKAEFLTKSSSEWYLDSGCSRNITRDKTFFTSLKDYNGGIVAFEDGSLAHVKGKGSISILSCPKLNGVMYVDGLKANLLSITQIYDKDHRVNFAKTYVRTPLMCSRAKLDPMELWHRRLGHIIYRDLVHLVNIKKVRGIPRLSGELKAICGKCMKVKKIRTTSPLNLLHMDLMGPIHTESRSGKRYVLVVVDDFSRYSFIVNVNGSILDRKSMGEDLFWAIRGGGGASFGVILSYKIKLVRVPEIVTVFRVEKTLAQNATDIAYQWQHITDKIDNDLFIRLLLQPITVKNDNGSAKAEKSTKTVKVSFTSLFLGDATRLISVINKDFPELGLKKEDCIEMSWIESVLYWANFDNGTSVNVLLNRTPESVKFLKRKSDYVQKPISKDGLEGLWKKIIELGKAGMIQYSVTWQEEGTEADKKYVNSMRELYSYMTPYVSKSPRGSYLNYRDIDIGISHNGKDSYQEGKVYGVKYFMNNFDRLVKVKTAVDPQNFFRYEQSIPPLPY